MQGRSKVIGIASGATQLRGALLNILRAASLISTGLLWGSYLASRINPAWIATPGLLPMGYPIWVGLCLAATLGLALCRHREAWLPLLSILLGGFNILDYLGIHRPGATKEPSFRVMIYNVKYFSYRLVHEGEIRKRVSAIRQEILREQPDILCAQDFMALGNLAETPLASLTQDGGLLYHSKDVGDTMILSKFPILDQASKVFSPMMGNSFTWADLQLPQGKLRVFNLHLHSYDLPSVPGRGSRPFRLYNRLCEGLQLRSSQADTVAESIAESPYPVVVCGDFNEVPLSYAYRKISRGLQDGFRVSGWGSGISYAGPLPWLKIDYILCGPQLTPQNYRVLRIPGQLSDHNPAICELHWEGQRP